MSGPKHLWSGDWENESAAAADDLAGRSAPTDPAPVAPAAVAGPARAVRPPAPIAPPPRVRRRRSRPRRPALSRRVLIALAAVLVIAAAAYGVTTLSGGSGSPTVTAADGGMAVQPAATGSARPITWLGMEIQTVPPGVAVIETVKLGSEGDRAGLEPGDVILQVNNRPINGAGDIAGAIRGLHSGDQVPLQISQGSALTQTAATLGAPPSAYP